MKTTLFFGTALAVTLAFASCGGDDEPSDNIKVQNEAALEQTVYADQTSGESGVTFTATGAWTSAITEGTVKATGDNAVAWIAIDPDHGGAGTHTVAILLEPNTTGADRTANIIISCSGSEMTVTLTQKGTKEDGTALTYIPLEESVAVFKSLYRQVLERWLQIDRQYSTLQARQGVTAQSSLLYDFWQKAYEAIVHCNNLLENVDRSPTLSASDKESLRASAFAYRGIVYFYLKTLFGGVPLTTSADHSETVLPRSSVQETNDLARADLDEANARLSGTAADTVRLTLAVQSMQNGNFQEARNILEQILHSGRISFVDVNNDGIIEADHPNNILFAQIYLLAAEACLNTGNRQQAMMYINVVYMADGRAMPFSNNDMETADETADETIRTALQGSFNYSTRSNGLKFLNAVRWQPEIWGFRQFLPVPIKAIEGNPNLMQNPGW